MGHINNLYMSKLHLTSRDLTEVVIPKGFDCDICTEAKMHRRSFPLRLETATEISDIIYADEFIAPVVSVDDYKSAILFTDDYSSFRKTYLMKSSSEIPVHFEHFRNLVKNQTGRDSKIFRTFRTDDAAVFKSRKMMELYSNYGIVHQPGTRYTPQTDGKSERGIRSIKEKTRALLIQAKLPQSFWSFAALHATNLLNYSPTRINNRFKCPYELWTGQKPSIEHFRVFGCDAFLYQPKAVRSTFDPTATPCIYLGHQQKAYLVLEIETNLIRVSTEVKFKETQFSHAKTFMDEDENENVNQNEFLDDEPNEQLEHALVEPEQDPLTLVTKASNQGETTTMDWILARLNMHADLEVTDSFDLVWDGSHGVYFTFPLNIPQIYKNIKQKIYHDQTPTVIVVIPSEMTDLIKMFQPILKQTALETKFDNINLTVCVVTGLPIKYKPNAMHTTTARYVPEQYKDIQKCQDSAKWTTAVNEELLAMEQNQVWELVPRQPGMKVLGNRYVFKVKENTDGSVERYKARLVAQGFAQIEGVDFTEKFAPVVKHIALRTFLALTNNFHMEIHQMDVNNAFLYGDCEDETYMKVPDGLDVSDNLVCKLKKSIYGLKTAPLQWNKKLHDTLTSIGFNRTGTDHCIYVKSENSKLEIIVVYVDDIAIATQNMEDMMKYKALLSTRFKMKDLGDIRYMIGWEISRDRKLGTMKISQNKYIQDTLVEFGMQDSKPEVTPMDPNVKLTDQMNAKGDEMVNIPYRQVIGKLNYLITGTRPDIANAVNIVSRFQQNPGLAHWTAVKRILRYLKGTADIGLTFTSNNESKITGYCDSDWAADHDKRRSTSGNLILGFGGILLWNSKRQNSTALSTTEAEYIAACECAKNVQYLRNLLLEMKIEIPRTVTLYEDNQGAIGMINNPTNHSRAKHIDIRYHFIRDLVNLKLIDLTYIPTENQLADLLTKPLPP
jgi:hypothetical protein